MRWDAFILMGLVSAAAGADERALTVEVGGGGTVLVMPAPLVPAGTSVPGQPGTAAHIRGAARYALRHGWEVGLGGFWEPGVRFTHRETSVASGEFQLEGALQHQVMRFGGVASMRAVTGLRWRFFAQLDLGWSRGLYSELHAFNTRNPGGAVEYPVNIADFAVDNLLAAIGGGVEYQLTDAITVGFAPRVEWMAGRESRFAFTAPLSVSWSWIL